MTAPVFSWTIDNFLDWIDNPINSPHFTIPSHPQIEWRLDLYPSGNHSKGFVSVYFTKLTDEFDVECEFELVMVGIDAKVELKTLRHVFISEDNAVSWGWPKFILKSQLISDFLVDGNLKIQVKKARLIQVIEVRNCLDATVFNWEIDDFLSLKEAKLTSDKFIIPGHPLIKWQLVCFPKEVDLNDNGKMKIYLEKCTDDCEIELEFRLTIFRGKKRGSWIKKTNYKNGFILSFYIQQALVNNYLANGMLKIQLKVFRVIKVVYEDHYLDYCYNKKSLDLDSTNKHCDFRLNTGYKSFDVHKLMLVRESPYFKKMFESDLNEDKESDEDEENEHDVSQFQENVIQEIYRFIYTGQLHNFDAISEKLIIAADYFQMNYLKILCQENMSFRLSLDNCLEFLEIAGQVNGTLLREAVFRFLKKNKSRMNKQNMNKFFRKKNHRELKTEWMLWSKSKK